MTVILAKTCVCIAGSTEAVGYDAWCSGQSEPHLRHIFLAHRTSHQLDSLHAPDIGQNNDHTSPHTRYEVAVV